MVKVWKRRRDGVRQRYNIKRKRKPKPVSELVRLQRLLSRKHISFPYKFVIKGDGWYSTSTFDNKKEIRHRILTIKNAKKEIYSCFFCDKFSKDKVGGRFMPMDKRASGDNLFGDTFACYRCIPKEYGRL